MKDWREDMSLSPAERETAQRLADEFVADRGRTVTGLDDLHRNTVTLKWEARERWARVHGQRIADYAYRHVDTSRIDSLFRQRYASTRRWYQPWEPPKGSWSDYVAKEILACTLIVVVVAMIAWQWLRLGDP